MMQYRIKYKIDGAWRYARGPLGDPLTYTDVAAAQSRARLIEEIDKRPTRVVDYKPKAGLKGGPR